VFSTGIVQESGTRLLGTAHYFICVGDEFEGLKPALAQLHQSIVRHPERAESLHFARSSFMMLEYLVEEAERLMDTSISGVLAADAFRENLATAQEFLREARKRAEIFEDDRDPLSGQTGVIQRAYVSSYHREIRPYTVFVPSTYDSSKPYPLISYMLSGGPTPDWRSSSEEQGRVRSESLALAEEKGFIMVWPRYRRLEAEANFFDVFAEMKRDYNIDLDRVYLMGVSGGGLASWLIGLLYPDQIAAICPISSVTITTVGPGDSQWRPHILSEERAALSAGGPEGESQVVLKAHSTYYFPMNALHVPVMILHSDADTSTLVDVQARPMVKKMRELGLEVEYVEYPGVGHGLGRFYADGFAKALDFFDKHRNVRHPKTIDYSTPSIRYNKAYWIKIGKFSEKGTFARVQAEAKGSTVEVKTENVAGFAVLRDAEVFDVSAPLTVVIDGENVFDGRFPETGGLGFVKNQEGAWQAK
jgi:acetyl esterase/lipase